MLHLRPARAKRTSVSHRDAILGELTSDLFELQLLKIQRLDGRSVARSLRRGCLAGYFEDPVGDRHSTQCKYTILCLVENAFGVVLLSLWVGREDLVGKVGRILIRKRLGECLGRDRLTGILERYERLE